MIFFILACSYLKNELTLLNNSIVQVHFKYILVLLMLISNQFLMAQGIAIQKEVAKIDSLIFYCKFSEGETVVDRLLEQLRKTDSKQEDLKLKLLLDKVYLYSRMRKTDKALALSLAIIDESKKYNLPEKEYQASLMVATIYELSGDFSIGKGYLDKANQLYKEHGLEKVYSVYCIRLSSYYRFMQKKDLAIYYAKKGIDYAKKYDNYREYMDGCLLLGILLSNSNYQESIKYSLLATAAFLKKKDYLAASFMYNNIANTYLKHKETDKALAYSDSVLRVLKINSLAENDSFYLTRSMVFDRIGNKDSAYYYFQKYHDLYVAHLAKTEALEIKKITEKYQNDKKEALIKTKDQEIVFVIGLLSVIVVATVLIIRKNRKINAQNRIITRQLKELIKTLDQKQVLLSELQHRVKNNLQHVISILEIQKESVDFNNIEEVIQDNQNRIQSMALLHQMLDTSENVNEVDLNNYITALSQLVKESYDTHQKKISLDISVEVQTLSVEKALPIGFIVVELVSNSMKHAFARQNSGNIKIYFTEEKDKSGYKLGYTDNGKGYDFNVASKKGLGMEIIKGFMEQLDASFESSGNNGFEFAVHFK